jgi:hypothetical protein
VGCGGLPAGVARFDAEWLMSTGAESYPKSACENEFFKNLSETLFSTA